MLDDQDDFGPGTNGGRKFHCRDKAHAAPVGWCSTCGAHWDHTTEVLEEEMLAATKRQIEQAQDNLRKARAALELLGDVERTPAVLIARVETRKHVRELEEFLTDLAPKWRIGGNAPIEKER